MQLAPPSSSDADVSGKSETRMKMKGDDKRKWWTIRRMVWAMRLWVDCFLFAGQNMLDIADNVVSFIQGLNLQTELHFYSCLSVGEFRRRCNQATLRGRRLRLSVSSSRHDDQVAGEVQGRGSRCRVASAETAGFYWKLILSAVL